MRSEVKSVLVGVVVGGIIGTSLGILFASDKGSVTRSKHAAFRKKVVAVVKEKVSNWVRAN